MATKRKTPKKRRSTKKPAARVFDDCGSAKGCKVQRPAGRRAASPPGFSYTTKVGPCVIGTRKSCPVQLVYKRGQPFLRLCREPERPGHLIPFRSVAQARKAAQEACRCWTRSSKDRKKRSFDRCAIVKKLSTGLGKSR